MSQMIDPSSTITSWYRDPARNAEVGGVPNSQHIFGIALDIAASENGRRTANNFASYGRGVWQVINEGDHYHIELADNVWHSVEDRLRPTRRAF